MFVVLAYGAACGAQSAPEPVPGLRIPNGGTPWVLDEFKGGKQLVPVHSTAVAINNHKGGNVAGGLLAGPFYKARFSTEIDGVAAKTVVHTGAPVFYVKIEGPETGQSLMAGWAVVHALVDRDRRLLSTVKFTQWTGNAKRNDTEVEVATETLPDGWVKITPKGQLPEGEYALEPVMKQENAFSTMVFDFRVDASAQNDADAVTE
ncbi:hypothetical protein D1Y84_05975 [Acidipila sp. EB88]|nr:hypothetical protein D1Y84_05975 [Acidipila sp. EB88]